MNKKIKIKFSNTKFIHKPPDNLVKSKDIVPEVIDIFKLAKEKNMKEMIMYRKELGIIENHQEP